VLAELANANTALRNAQVQYSRELWAPRSFDSNRTGGMGMPSMFDQMFTRNFASTMGYGNPSLDRYTDLYSSGSQISQGYSGVLQAQSMLEEIDAKLKDTRSVAPFGGVIVRKLAEVGDTVQPGQPLLVFADTKYLQVQVEVPARLMPGLEKGMILPARLDVGDTRVDVRVARIFPMADVQRHTVTVKFDMPLDAPGGPGMYAEVMVPDIKAPAKNLPVVPVASLVWRGSLPAVFVVNEDNRTELRLVRLGSYLNSRTVSILSGLHEGERVLAAPPAGMVSGWAPGEAQAGSPNKPR
jgi:RND family efflux transporter MFP subunit